MFCVCIKALLGKLTSIVNDIYSDIKVKYPNPQSLCICVYIKELRTTATVVWNYFVVKKIVVGNHIYENFLLENS